MLKSAGEERFLAQNKKCEKQFYAANKANQRAGKNLSGAYSAAG